MSYYYKAEEVRPLAAGNWLSVLDALAHSELEQAITRPGSHCACPVHGGKDGFRLFRDAHETGGGICNTCGSFPDGFEVLMWINRWKFTTALKHVGDLLNAPQHQKAAARTNVTPIQKDRPSKPKVDLERKAWLDKITEETAARAASEKQYRIHLGRKNEALWNQCVALTHPSAGPAVNYLRNRRVLARGLCPDAIRFCPELPYHDEDGQLKAKCPALVMAIRDLSGELQTLHRIYLTRTGLKARVGAPKKMMGIPEGKSVNGAAIPLTNLDASGVLSVAEGPETALAAKRVCGFPAWSTVNAVLLEQFEVPEGVHTVLIWADKDRSMTGETSAQILETRLKDQGINVYVFVPAMPIPARAKGVDWNDVLMHQGFLGFPRRELLSKLLKTGSQKQDVA